MRKLLAPAITAFLVILFAIFAFELVESKDGSEKVENSVKVVTSPSSSPTSDRYVSKIKSDEGLTSAISQGNDADFVSGGDASTNNLDDSRPTLSSEGK